MTTPYWKIRLAGGGLMAVGGWLLVTAIRTQGEWAPVLIGLLAVALCAFGFGMLILPREEPPDTPSAG